MSGGADSSGGRRAVIATESGARGLAANLVLLAVFAVCASIAACGFRLVDTFAATWDVAWAVTSGCVGGFAFWRLARPGGRMVILPAILWFAALAIGVVRDGAILQGVADWELAVALVSTVALVAAIQPTWTSLFLLFGVAGSTLAFQFARAPAMGVPLGRHFDAAIAAGVVLTASLSARARGLLAVVAGAATIGVAWTLEGSVIGAASSYYGAGGHAVGVCLCTACLVVLALALGTRIRSIGTDADPERGTTLAVACGRNPWDVSVAVALVLALGAENWMWSHPDFGWWPRRRAVEFLDSGTLWAFLAAGFSFLAHVARGGRSTFDRLAPWFGANAAVALFAWILARGPWNGYDPEYSTTPLVLAMWSLVSGLVLHDRLSISVARVLAIALPTALVALPIVSAEAYKDVGRWFLCFPCCALLLPLGFHAAVRSDLPSMGIAIGATALGAASAWGRIGAYDGLGHTAAIAFTIDPAVWLLAGLLVIAARRCRSMTAVPADHPLVTDWGRR